MHPWALRRQNLANRQNPAHLPNRSRVPPRRSPSRKFGGGQRTAHPTKGAKVGRVTPCAPLFSHGSRFSAQKQSSCARRVEQAPRQTLFVESAAGVPVLRFEAPFLSVLSDMGVSLECAYEDA